MLLNNLQLKNFRSYQNQEFEFSSGTNIILGPNTSGKTNLFEAIRLLSTGKSFRARRDGEMVHWDKEKAVVSGRVGETALSVELTRGQVHQIPTPVKRFRVNGVVRQSINFAGNLKSVLFWPEDLELVTHAPSLRRQYLDAVLIQTDREYRRSLNSYEKGIRQRNRLLERIRDEGISRSQLWFWDQLVIKTGNELTRRRREFFSQVNLGVKPFGDFRVVYDASEISTARLAQYGQAEVAAATTLVGPHRDDFLVLEGERDLAKYGSRGEQRLVVLWLKISEIEYISAISGEQPVLLLDDIFSELDHEHRQAVEQIVTRQQTFISATDAHFLPEKLAAQKGARKITLCK